MTRALIKQLVIFGLVGVLATAVHYVIALLAVEFLLLSVYLANIVGYLFAVGVSLFGHGRFTYRKRIDQVVAIKFACASLATLACTELILLMLGAVWGLPPKISMGIVVCSVPVLSFCINKYWVYASPRLM